jgi:uncharacterized membrane protein
MADFVAIEYDDEFKAQEVRLTLLKLQKEYLIDLADAVVAVKDSKGKVKLHQAVNMTATGAARGGFWGTLVGLLFFGPFFGIGTLAGAAAGAVSGALTDIGIDDNFMKKLSEGFKPGTSALFVLVRSATADKVLEEIKKYGGTVLHTSLCHENQAKLQAALNEAQASVDSPDASAPATA